VQFRQRHLALTLATLHLRCGDASLAFESPTLEAGLVPGVATLTQLFNHFESLCHEQFVALVAAEWKVAEQVLQQTRPQVAADVLPCVVFDLHDRAVEWKIGQGVICAAFTDQLVDAALKIAQKVTLSASPVAEKAHGKRGDEFLGRDKVRKCVHLGCDADEIRRVERRFHRWSAIHRAVWLVCGQLHRGGGVGVEALEKFDKGLTAGGVGTIIGRVDAGRGEPLEIGTEEHVQFDLSIVETITYPGRRWV
jgi:hypothetical protein